MPLFMLNISCYHCSCFLQKTTFDIEVNDTISNHQIYIKPTFNDIVIDQITLFNNNSTTACHLAHLHML